jgi:hypothetical protein
VSLGQATKSGKESIDPASSSASREQVPGQCKREEGSHRTCPHRGKIAETAREGPVPNRLRRMPVAAEVATFEREVRGDENLVALRRAEDGTIIANA